MCGHVEFTFSDEDVAENTTLLHIAVAHTDVDALMRHGFEPTWNCVDSHGRHALTTTMRSGNFDVDLLQKLINVGVNIEMRDSLNRTALYYAMERLMQQVFFLEDRVEDAIRTLLVNGADPLSRDSCIDAAKDVLLSYIRKVKHDELGMTHVCCTLPFPKTKNMSEDDIHDIIEEELEFIEILNDDMQQLSDKSFNELLHYWFSQIQADLLQELKDALSLSEKSEGKGEAFRRFKPQIDYDGDRFINRGAAFTSDLGIIELLSGLAVYIVHVVRMHHSGDETYQLEDKQRPCVPSTNYTVTKSDSANWYTARAVQDSIGR
ncbi:hypothetical protein QQS21_011989 [Conoideocrella luteorostrata]|uniref:Ankyrin repeat protein n=1 Tax=Conoideocrella luteorostrata TaxID=1105319 RepID=A0AAJ0CD36_9HYPO|nr:hypothetical protein QQS21_011989 [Conoideocrella luteorostrata]